MKTVAEERAPYTVAGHAPERGDPRLIKDLESQMKAAAKNLEFEKAALLRDQIVELRKQMVSEPDALHEFATAAGQPGPLFGNRRGRRPYRR